MTILYRLALAALLLASPAVAQKTAKPAPKPKPPAAKPKPKTPLIAISPLSHDEKDGFSILQVAVPDSAKFIAGWKLGAGGGSATTRTVANQPLFTFLIFRGCKANAQGNCDVVADYVIHRPDGTTNEENKDFVVWNKTAPTDPKKPYLSDGALGYGVDDEGPFGDYRVVATVTDRVAGITLTTEQTLTIKPAKATPPAKANDPKPADPAPAKPMGPDLPAEPPAK
ncbi:MAG: hypothetical protein J0J06_10385 [Sphingomonas sp.]|uniref:hypothetical protein n=1 Tax=Sphingomonas sp. TaxID=28214 RepID=UPI001AC3F6F1|nr:hypothetical protein [Sphingomonas sp.]MBN8815842.1 hypothetical protein [Sphingomonas sp.]